MSDLSFIYRNIWVYRMTMNVLYSFGYKTRFDKVISIIEKYKPKNVLELCFGDIQIANYCKNKGIRWTGIDLNKNFVMRAKRKGFDATREDLIQLSDFPKAELCIIMGSFYHFYNNASLLLFKMLNASDRIIISEPVKNLSDKKNLLGWIAKRSANAGKGNEHFRYSNSTLHKLLEEEAQKLNFTFKMMDSFKKDSIIIIEKNGTH